MFVYKLLKNHDGLLCTDSTNFKYRVNDYDRRSYYLQIFELRDIELNAL